MSVMKSRGLIVLISDYIGLDKAWAQYLRVAAKRFDIIGVMVRDPRDRRLPKHAGEYVLEDPFTDEKVIIDCAQYWRPYETYVKELEQDITEVFRSVQSDCLLLETDEDYVKKLMTFFRKRERQVVER
jgi:hypothetical protein